MAGEISNLYGNNLYNFNPYSVNNDDFVSNNALKGNE